MRHVARENESCHTDQTLDSQRADFRQSQRAIECAVCCSDVLQ